MFRILLVGCVLLILLELVCCSQCWSHQSRLIARISRQICKFSNTCNCSQLEKLWTPRKSLDAPNKIILHLGDVQKAGVLGCVRPGLRTSKIKKTSKCSSGDLEIKTDKFYSFLKQRDKVFLCLLLEFWRFLNFWSEQWPN